MTASPKSKPQNDSAAGPLRSAPGAKGSGEPQDRQSATKDVVLVHGVTQDRKGLRVLRAREQKVEFGEVRPVVEGQPITSDLVRLRPRPEAPFICDVETEYAAPRTPRSDQMRSGPAQVATQAYRDNWDAIWAHDVTAPGSDRLN